MAERIELPPVLQGTAEEQAQQIRNYLYRIATALNVNLDTAGSETVTLTDEERILMNNIASAGSGGGSDGTYYPGSKGFAEAETLKSLIIKTAQFAKTVMDTYNLILYGEESAQSDYGTWNRKKGLRVDVTPDGIKQTYSYAEIVKGLKDYELNAKAYIKTGYLHDDDDPDDPQPVYGVAIGKDVVTFSEDGTETFVDGNKVAELTADELAFFQQVSGQNVKVASYTGDRLAFYNGGTNPVMYIQNGKIYMAKGMEITSEEGIKMTSSGFVQILGKDNSVIQLDGSGSDDTIFKADSTGVVKARALTSSGITAADAVVTNLTVLGRINANIQVPNIVVSANPPASGYGTIWLEPVNGVVTPFSYTQNVNDAQTGSWSTVTTNLKWTQTCSLAVGIPAAGANRLKIAGNLYKNGSTAAWDGVLEAVANVTGGNVSSVNLGTIGTFPYMQSLKWDYGFSKEISTAIASGTITSITYTWTISRTTDAFAALSYPHEVTLTCSGQMGSGSSDECTVHYVP